MPVLRRLLLILSLALRHVLHPAVFLDVGFTDLKIFSAHEGVLAGLHSLDMSNIVFVSQPHRTRWARVASPFLLVQVTAVSAYHLRLFQRPVDEIKEIMIHIPVLTTLAAV